MSDRPVVSAIEAHFDDRGSVYCALDNMDFGQVKRTYVVRNWERGCIRAWHGHREAWTGMHVIRGAAKIIARNMDEPSDITAAVLSELGPGIFWIPPGFYNGAVSLSADTRILVYSTLTFNEVKLDDVRLKLSDEDKKLFEVANR